MIFLAQEVARHMFAPLGISIRNWKKPGMSVYGVSSQNLQE
jgi:hypothetical protein